MSLFNLSASHVVQLSWAEMVQCLLFNILNSLHLVLNLLKQEKLESFHPHLSSSDIA